MDTSFDKYNKEFAEQQKSGVKETLCMIMTYFWIVLGLGICVLALVNAVPQLIENGKSSYIYFCLLSLIFGLFGINFASKAKQGGEWRKKYTIPAIINGVVIGLSSFVLYVLPYMFDK